MNTANSVATEPPANVLLASDRPAELVALEAMLADPGLSLVRAHPGEETVQTLRDADFAAVLLDVPAPGLGAVELIRQIRSRDRSPPTPVMFLADPDTPELRLSEAYRLGAVDHLERPLDAVILQAKVAGFVDLYRKDERLRGVVIDNLTDYALFLLGPEGHVRTWNAGAERLLGYTAREIIGTHFRQFFTDEDRAAGRPERELREGAANGRVSDDNWLVCKGGGRIWASGVSAALYDRAGRVQRFVKVIRDLTTHKRLEDELHRRVEQLDEADRQKNDFLAFLGHELRNPLGTMYTAMELLTLRGSDPAVVARARDMLERQTAQMTRLADDLLDVSRVARGKLLLRSERLDLANVIRAAAEDHRAKLEAAGLTLTVGVPAGAVWVRGDDVRLTQIVSNLLTNAGKFTERGGSVAVRLAVEGREAILSVADTGIGVRPEALPRLFNSFWQENSGHGHRQGGLGLGLCLVKGLVELHGGRVEAESPGLGKGTTFTVRLPLDLGPAQTA